MAKEHGFTINGMIAEVNAMAVVMNEMREALIWYERHVAGCRKITSEGDESRKQLDADGGLTARRALASFAERMEKADG